MSHPNSLLNLALHNRALSIAKTLSAGKRFGKLVVIARLSGAGIARYSVRCDCGSVRTVSGNSLKNGGTKACAINHCRWSWTKHGFSRKGRRAPEYTVWKTMRQRCVNPNHHKFHGYGGRGVVVCKRWSLFANFIADMGRRPSSRHSIERRDNDGNYAPENCYWATPKQQARNRRNNRILHFMGKRQPVAAWAEELNVRPDFIHSRLSEGWSAKRALTEPPHWRGQKIWKQTKH